MWNTLRGFSIVTKFLLFMMIACLLIAVGCLLTNNLVFAAVFVICYMAFLCLFAFSGHKDSIRESDES